MPRASKAVDAAKQLGSKVAAAGATKSTPKAATKSTPKAATKATKATKAATKSARSTKSSPKTAKDVRPAIPVKASKTTAPAGKTASGSKAPATVKKPAKAVAKVVQKVVEKAAKATKPAEKPAKRLEGAGADKFFEEQRALLAEERISYLAQAADLKAEADQLAQEMEPGDIQFDDESGEGATAAVDRERDLALSAQARVEVDEIDHALAKLDGGSYGICEGCGQPVPRARLKALPHARLCVACKSGGLSRR